MARTGVTLFLALSIGFMLGGPTEAWAAKSDKKGKKKATASHSSGGAGTQDSPSWNGGGPDSISDIADRTTGRAGGRATLGGDHSHGGYGGGRSASWGPDGGGGGGGNSSLFRESEEGILEGFLRVRPVLLSLSGEDRTALLRVALENASSGTAGWLAAGGALAAAAAVPRLRRATSVRLGGLSRLLPVVPLSVLAMQANASTRAQTEAGVPTHLLEGDEPEMGVALSGMEELLDRALQEDNPDVLASLILQEPIIPIIQHIVLLSE